MLTLKIGKEGKDCKLQSGRLRPKTLFEGTLQAAISAARRNVVDRPGTVLTVEDPFNVLHLFDEEVRDGLPFGLMFFSHFGVRRLGWQFIGN